MDTTIDSGAVVIATIVYFVLIAGFYVWSSFALSKVFAKQGIPAWKAWVPVINTIEILKLGGHEAWNIVWFFIPFLSVYGIVLWIISLHRITVKFGQSILMSIVAVVAFPVWASILGFGSAQPEGQTDRRIAAAPSGAPWGGTAAAQPFGAPSAVPAYPASQGPSNFATFPAASPEPAPVVASAAPAAPVPVAPPTPPAPPAGVTLPPPPAPAAVTPPPAAPPAPVSAPVPPVVLPTAAPPAASATPPDLVEPAAYNPWAPAAPTAPIAPPVAAPVISAPPAAPVAPPVSPAPVAAPVAPPAPPAAPVAPPVAAPVAAPAAPAIEDEADEDERTIVVNRKPVIRWHLVAPTGQRLPLVGDDIVLGRKPTAADGGTPLAVPDTTKTLSRVHARLTRGADDSWTITDLNATNGVIVIDAAGGESELAPGASAPVATSFILGEVRLSIEFDAES